MYSLFPTILIITLTVVNLLILIFVLKKKTLNVMLSSSIVLFDLGVLGWQLSLISINFIADSLLLHKFAFVAALAAVSGALGLGLTFPDKEVKRKTQALFGLAVVFNSVLSFIILFTNIMVSGYDAVNQQVYFGALGKHLVISLATQIIGMIAIFVYRYRRESHERYYFKYLFIAFGFYGLVATIINLVLPLLGITELALLGSLLAVLPQIAIVYTVVSERLHSLTYLVRMILFVIAVSVLLWLVFNFVAVVIGALTLGKVIEIKYVLLSGAFFTVVTYVFILSQNTISKVIYDVATFSGESAKQIVRETSKKMTTKLTVDGLLDLYSESIDTLFGPDYIVIHFINSKNSEVYEKNNNKNADRLDLQRVLDLVKEATPGSVFLSRERFISGNLELKEMFDNLDVQLVNIIGHGEEVTGLALFGSKRDSSPYTVQDIDMVETLGLNISVALERALLYTEVVAFNRKLQAEIATATKDLQTRNKRLVVLRELDQIILNTLEVRDMAQKIVDLVSWEVGLVGAAMVFLEDEADGQYLRLGAFSDTPVYNEAVKSLGRPLHEFRSKWGSDPSNLFYKALTERKPYATENFRDLYVPPLTIDQSNKLQNATRSRYLVVYPLSAKGTPLGGIAFDLHRPYSEMGTEELELIESFMDEAGIAILNAQLYTQLRDRNEDLRLANLKLKQLDQMKDELVSVASHELRTPMTAIKSYIWMALNKQAKNLTPNLHKYLERAYVSSDRMISLVNDMLSASRLEGGRIELTLEGHDIVPIVTETVEQLIPKSDEKGLKLSFKVPQGDFPPALIDESRFREILFNVIGNAVKYTDKGSIKVSLSTNPNGSPQGQIGDNDSKEYIWVSVADTGRGVAEEDLPRLFKKFSKLEQGSFAKTAEVGGTGLGLYITKGLVELHGGKIWVESEGEGKGSSFIFSLRVA